MSSVLKVPKTRSNCPDTLSAPTSLTECPQMTGACDWAPPAVNPLCLRAKAKIWEIIQGNDKSVETDWLQLPRSYQRHLVLSLAPDARESTTGPRRRVPFVSGSCNTPKQKPTFAHRRWNITTSSAFRSDRSSFPPFSITSGCLRTSSQPTWAKKNPCLALWGSASVSEYLWWTRWSLAHSNMSF